MKRSRLMTAGIFAFAAACSSSPTGTDTTTATEDATITQDVATMAADGAAEDIDVMAGMDGDIGNITISADMSNDNNQAFAFGGGGHRPGITGCTFASGSFNCPAVNKNGLSISRTITFFDAVGGTQTDYDSLTTASIHIIADISGSRTRGPWTADVARHRDFTISGLAGHETTRTVNGTGSETVNNSRVTENGATRTNTTTGSSVIADVVLPVKSDGTDPWPLSGTITRTFTMTITSGPHSGDSRTRTVVITFDGTGTPGATVNGDPFTIDLTHRSAAKH